jgi:anti-anti-sigma factor
MAAKVEIKGEVARIILSGAIDFSTQGKLAEAIDQALSSARTNEVRVDMGAATFIDSSVIRALLQLQERARASGKSMSIWNCNEHIMEIFVIGGFDQMLMIH